MIDALKLTTPARVGAAIARMQQAGAVHYAPLLRAVWAGEIAAAFMLPGPPLRLRLLDLTRATRPLVIVVAGDVRAVGVPGAGPDDFPHATRLLRWADFALLHGGAGEPEHYAVAVGAARTVPRVLIVESDGANLAAWVALKGEVAPDCPEIVLVPGPASAGRSAPEGATVH